MNPEELHNQRELEEEILHYVREMERQAPVTVETLLGYLQQVRRRRVLRSELEDRLLYLVKAGQLERKVEWQDGDDFEWFEVTRAGMDRLDGVTPPPGWRPR